MYNKHSLVIFSEENYTPDSAEMKELMPSFLSRKLKDFFTTAPAETPVPTETPAPTKTPAPTETPAPTLTETPSPTETPTSNPTIAPTEEPTTKPSEVPTPKPTITPTEKPATSPTIAPVNTKEPNTDEDDSQNPDEFHNVEWNVSSAPLQVGKSTTKVKAVCDNDTISKYVTSNPNVATVSSKGVITGKSVGNATIRAITKHGCTADVRIKVQKKAVTTKKLTVKSRNIHLKPGKVYNLNAQITPITSTQRITYKSSKSKVAVVNSKGQIKAKKTGKAVITVKSGKKVIKVNVIVKK